MDKEYRTLPLRRLSNPCMRTCDAGGAILLVSHIKYLPLPLEKHSKCFHSRLYDHHWSNVDISSSGYIYSRRSHHERQLYPRAPRHLRSKRARLQYLSYVPSLYAQEATITLRLESSSCNQDASIQYRRDGCRYISHDVLHDRVVGSVTRGCFETHGPELSAPVPAP